MAMDDLFTALKMFKEGVGQLQTSRVLNQANEMVQQVRTSEMNEQQKRAQLQDISNQLVGHMTALGNPAAAVQQVASAFGPKQYASADQAMLEGSLTGNKDLIKAAVQADEMSTANQMKMFNAKVKAQEESQMRLFSHQEALARLRKGVGGKDMSDTELTKIQDLEATHVAGQELLAGFKPEYVGPMASRIPGRELFDSDFAAYKAQVGQFFDKYRVAVTGAGASPGELKMLKENVPSMSDTPENFKKKMERTLAIGERIKSKYLDILTRGGRNTSGFVQGRSTASPEPAASGAGPIVGVTMYK